MTADTRSGNTKTTVAILTRNEGPRLARCVRAVLGQRTEAPFEVLVIDSSSHSGALSCLDGTPVRRILVPPETFNHGATRNLAARMARGRFVAFLVADAVPIGRFWLQRLVSALASVPDAAGAYGRQRAWPNIDPALKRRIEAWTPQGTGPVVKRLASPAEFQRLAPADRVRTAAFDNVNSIVRRDVVLEHPFPESSFGEDILWGRDRLLEGHAIVYVPGAEVWHAHRRPVWEHARRSRIEHAMLIREFGLMAVPSLPALFVQIVGAVLRVGRDGPAGASRQAAEAVGQYLARFAS